MWGLRPLLAFLESGVLSLLGGLIFEFHMCDLGLACDLQLQQLTKELVVPFVRPAWASSCQCPARDPQIALPRPSQTPLKPLLGGSTGRMGQDGPLPGPSTARCAEGRARAVRFLPVLAAPSAKIFLMRFFPMASYTTQFKAYNSVASSIFRGCTHHCC